MVKRWSLYRLSRWRVAGGCVFYYLSAFNTTPPTAQVLLWVVSFVLSGWLWWGGLWTVWRSGWGERPPEQSRTWRRLRLLPGLYLLPLPWLVWVHAQSDSGTSLAALRGAVLVRDRLHWNNQGSDLALNALFLLLAAAETAGTLWLLRRSGSLTTARVLALVLLSGGASMVVLCALSEIGFRLH